MSNKKENRTKVKKQFTKHNKLNKDRATRTPLKVDRMCSDWKADPAIMFINEIHAILFAFV